MPRQSTADLQHLSCQGRQQECPGGAKLLSRSGSHHSPMWLFSRQARKHTGRPLSTVSLATKALLPGATGGSQNTGERSLCHIVKTQVLPVGSPVCLPQDFQKTAGRTERGLWGWHYRRRSIKCVLLAAPSQLCGLECSPGKWAMRSVT